MTNWIKRRSHEEVTTYFVEFREKSKPDVGGYMYETTIGGSLLDSTKTERVSTLRADERYEEEHREFTSWHHEPAVIACECCRRHVTLRGFTNTCECGADYNMSGQMLADRSQWGEETGESVQDILSVDTISSCTGNKS